MMSKGTRMDTEIRTGNWQAEPGRRPETGKRRAVQRPEAELLAPAGSFESMKAAVSAGADAVYIGGSRFGARAYADNLDEDRMLSAIDYAHLHGVSLYMTVNTLVKEKEIDGLYDYLRPYYERGLDAVIVQDLGVFAAVRRWFPDLRVHASTQMTVTGAEGARLLKEMGAVRVMTARELSLEELRRIRGRAEMETESFVHGALCYCYSGQCLLSSLIGGRSGNRGRCAQPCRLPYEACGLCSDRTGGKAYLMSLKDLCTLELLPDILESGVCSLKIEGRMKSPRYTAGVVSIYRKYLDLYQNEGRSGYHVEPEDQKRLLELFDRGGHTDGYYRRHNGRDMLALKEKPAFRQVNQSWLDDLDETYVNTEKKEKLRGKLTVHEGEPLRLRLWKDRKGGGPAFTAEVAGDIVQTAKNQPMTAEKLEKQLRKTGGTAFEWERLELDLSGSVFVPVQALNELRRQGFGKLQETVCGSFRRERREAPVFEKAGGSVNGGEIRLHALVSDLRQFAQAVREPDLAEIQIETDLVSPAQWAALAESCHSAGKACVLALPVIWRTEAETFFRKWRREFLGAGFDGLLVRSMEEAALGRREDQPFGPIPVFADHSLYTFNHEAARFWAGLGCSRLTLPLEQNGGELEELRRACAGMRTGNADAERQAAAVSFELVAYGYLPVMVTAQCVRRTVSGCDRQEGFLTLKDRTGKELPVRNHCTFCYNQIFNTTPLSLLGLEAGVRRIAPDALRLQFLKETPEEVSEIVRAYADSFVRSAPGGEEPVCRNVPAWMEHFTRGHMKRGVE